MTKSKKRLLLLIGFSIIFLIFGLFAWNVYSSKQRNRPQEEKAAKTRKNNPVATVENFLITYSQGNGSEALTYFSNDFREKVSSAEGSSNIDKLNSYFKMVLKPSGIFSIDEAVYNNERAFVTSKVRVYFGIVERNFELVKVENDWKVAGVETVHPWITYQHPKGNLSIKIPQNMKVDANTQSQDMALFFGEDSHPLIMVIATEQSLPEEATAISNCGSKDECIEVEINGIPFQKTIKDKSLENELTVTLSSVTKNFTYIISAGTLDKYPEEFKLIEEILATVEVN